MNDFLLKLALPTILPPPPSMRGALQAFPKPGKLPMISAAYKDTVKAPISAAAKRTLGTVATGHGAVDGAISGTLGQAGATIAPGKLIKASSAAFLAELASMIEEGTAPAMLDGKFAAADVEALVKEALNLQGVGHALKGGLQGARGAVANVAGKISPTLNKPVMGLAQGAAHKLQHSPNSFAQGVGNVLHHKTQTPGKALLAAANPVGTAAEAITAGAGTAASKGLAAAGGRLQRATAAGDAVVRTGRGMTPKGRLMNAAESFGGKVQQSFSPGGAGHAVATKHLPLAGEIGGAVGAGLALHAPVGLAGVAGKMGLMGAGKLAPAVGAALEHAPHAADAFAQKVAPALKGVGSVLHHGAEDILGTAKQNLVGRLAQPAAAAARHSLLPPAMA